MSMTFSFQQIGKIFLSFWFAPALLLIISIFVLQDHSGSSQAPLENEVGLWTIISRNVTVYAAIFLLGFLHKTLPFILYYYNSVVFAFYLSVSIETNGTIYSLIKVLPHGILEILSFALITYLAYQIKNTKLRKKESIYLVSGLVMLLAAACIERYISPMF